ncbi:MULTISPECIES: DMT family transporter [Cyanophyceae]|uniref:DMT family transporter n=1 Tax=Cyanophyceae TaxID=3028117 RepID=UPI001688B7F4|nr:DMT family transporter [Trichocoleus sp. FACHB-40]MBD2004732.1 DMT family transporter [Trichocoleus sp. FACHB-40]
MIVYVKLALTALIWGGTFIAGRIVVQSMEPFSVAFCRFAIASLCLLLFTHKEGSLPKLKPQQILQVVLLGLTGVFAYNAFFFLGLKTITASRAALIVALNPVFIALCSAIVFKEKLTPLKLTGILTSLLGATVVISKGNLLNFLAGNLGWGEVFLLGCVFSWVAYTLIGKLAMKELSPLAASTYACVIGAIALFFPAWMEGLAQNFGQISLTAWLGVFYLGFLGSAVGFNWYYEGVQAIGAAKASVFINLVPVSAILLAAILLNEQLTATLLLGGALVVIGVFFTNRG